MRAWDYPFDRVIVECKRCDRRGEYSKRRFIELVGGDTELTATRFKIAKDCRHEKSGLALHNRCEVGYPDLVKLRPDKKP